MAMIGVPKCPKFGCDEWATEELVFQYEGHTVIIKYCRRHAEELFTEKRLEADGRVHRG